MGAIRTGFTVGGAAIGLSTLIAGIVPNVMTHVGVIGLAVKGTALAQPLAAAGAAIYTSAPWLASLGAPIAAALATIGTPVVAACLILAAAVAIPFIANALGKTIETPPTASYGHHMSDNSRGYDSRSTPDLNPNLGRGTSVPGVNNLLETTSYTKSGYQFDIPSQGNGNFRQQVQQPAGARQGWGIGGDGRS